MFNGKTVLLLAFIAMVSAFPNVNSEETGAPHAMDAAELKNAGDLLEKTMTTSEHGYKLVKVLSGTSQVIAGTRYVLLVELVDSNDITKECEVTMISQPWEVNGTSLKFNCNGEDE